MPPQRHEVPDGSIDEQPIVACDAARSRWVPGAFEKSPITQALRVYDSRLSCSDAIVILCVWIHWGDLVRIGTISIRPLDETHG